MTSTATWPSTSTGDALGRDPLSREPLTWREFRELRKQFREMIPVKPGCRHVGQHANIANPECHGYGPEWSYSRHSVLARGGQT